MHIFSKVLYKNPVFLGAVFVAVVYFFSNPNPKYFYDYTFRIAEALLSGRLGLLGQPPSWLNEFVPFRGMFYSVFPLGSVITVLPAALLKIVGLIDIFPSEVLAAFIGGLCFVFCYKLAGIKDLTSRKRFFLALFPLLGTWAWPNITHGGAWQMALAFAMLGEFGALYFILIRKNYILAGLFFALAFGNRTELAILGPLFLYLIFIENKENIRSVKIEPYVKFAIIPFVLLVATLLYNYLRFSSFMDFGYARIPGVLEEPWYQHGIFSIYAIPLNIHKMLIQGWKFLDHYPFFLPDGFGDSILLSSPFLFLLFRENSHDKKIKVVSWISIGILTVVLFVHGNPGGWQFSYRYAMILIPWIYMIILNNSPRKILPTEIILFSLSVFINGWAVYLYYWTDFIR